jgi:hypothetical protein
VVDRMTAFAAALARPDGAPALFNDGALELAPRLELSDALPGLVVFPDTGYAVVRDGELWLAFDCGPPGPAYLPAHAHADALSIQLWHDGRPVVVDPGTSTYEAGAERDRERSTEAHSTIALGGRSQFEPWGAFRSGPFPSIRVLSDSPLSAEVVWGNGDRHRRTLAWDAREVRISDQVELRRRTEVVSSLPLAPGGDVEIELHGPLAASREPRLVAERLFDARAAEAYVGRATAEGRVELGWTILLPR